MPLFSPRDRIAILVFGALILTGWGYRLVRTPGPEDDLRLIRGAVPIPAPNDTAGSSPASPLTESTAPAAGFRRVNLNRAPADELETLPLIGPAKAAAIIRWREENGPFARPGDVMKVKGIGPKIYERIAPYVATGDSGG